MRLKGRKVRLYVDGEVVGFSVGCSLDINVETVEAAANSLGRSSLYVRYGYDVSCEYMLTSRVLPSHVTWSMTVAGLEVSGVANVATQTLKASVAGYTLRSVTLKGLGAIHLGDIEEWDLGNADTEGDEIVDLGDAGVTAEDEIIDLNQ